LKNEVSADNEQKIEESEEKGQIGRKIDRLRERRKVKNNLRYPPEKTGQEQKTSEQETDKQEQTSEQETDKQETDKQETDKQEQEQKTEQEQEQTTEQEQKTEFASRTEGRVSGEPRASLRPEQEQTTEQNQRKELDEKLRKCERNPQDFRNLTPKALRRKVIKWEAKKKKKKERVKLDEQRVNQGFYTFSIRDDRDYKTIDNRKVIISPCLF
jgi:hypothetical protein